MTRDPQAQDASSQDLAKPQIHHPRQIQRLNDKLRQTGQGGVILLTNGVQALSGICLHEICEAVAKFDRFNEDNDPYGEHDFGSLRVGRHSVFWKIDYYDTDLIGGSPDPADPNLTSRVLTIMLAHEY